MVRYTQTRKFTATSTNAHYLNDENAKKTIESGQMTDHSITASRRKFISNIVREAMHKVIEGAENIVKWKKKLKSRTLCNIQFLVVSPTSTG